MNKNQYRNKGFNIVYTEQTAEKLFNYILMKIRKFLLLICKHKMRSSLQSIKHYKTKSD